MKLGCVLENAFRLWERSRGRNMREVLAILGDRHGGDLTLQVVIWLENAVAVVQ